MKINYQFNESEINKFIELRKQSKDNKVRDKLLSLILIGKLSLTVDEVSNIIGTTKRTVENWLKMFINEGLDGLLRNNYKPKKPYLNHYQKNQVKIFVSFEYPEQSKRLFIM